MKIVELILAEDMLKLIMYNTMVSIYGGLDQVLFQCVHGKALKRSPSYCKLQLYSALNVY